MRRTTPPPALLAAAGAGLVPRDPSDGPHPHLRGRGMGRRILRPKFHLRVLRLGHRHSPQRCGEFWREGVWWCGGAVRSLWLCALVLSVFVITIVEEAV